MKKQRSFVSFCKGMLAVYSVFLCFAAVLFFAYLFFLCSPSLKTKFDSEDSVLFFSLQFSACILWVVSSCLGILNIHKRRKKFIKLCNDPSEKTLLLFGSKILRKNPNWSANQQLCCCDCFESADTAAAFLQKRRQCTKKIKIHSVFYPFSENDLRFFKNKTIVVQFEFAEYFLHLSKDETFIRNQNRLLFERNAAGDPPQEWIEI